MNPALNCNDITSFKRFIIYQIFKIFGLVTELLNSLHRINVAGHHVNYNMRIVGKFAKSDRTVIFFVAIFMPGHYSKIRSLHFLPSNRIRTILFKPSGNIQKFKAVAGGVTNGVVKRCKRDATRIKGKPPKLPKGPLLFITTKFICPFLIYKIFIDIKKYEINFEMIQGSCS